MPARPKKAPTPRLRGRIWVDLRGLGALTEAGADLLEQIDACGSLSEAARRLRFSYRRAWMLVSAMNKRWPEPLVTTATGGKRGGGSSLTDYGRIVLRSFRDVQLHMEAFLDEAGHTFVSGLNLDPPAR
jgi:molybdate transport system regulatory protein